MPLKDPFRRELGQLNFVMTLHCRTVDSPAWGRSGTRNHERAMLCSWLPPGVGKTREQLYAKRLQCEVKERHLIALSSEAFFGLDGLSGMSLLDEIRGQVSELAQSLDIAEPKEPKAFAYWFLEEFEDLSHEEALDTVVDGPWDGGRDAVYADEPASTLRIYQFKYSRDKEYVLGGFSDLQRAIQMEAPNIPHFAEVQLTLVTIAEADNDFVGAQRRTQQLAEEWLGNRGFTSEVSVEVVDITRLSQLSDRIYGVSVDSLFKTPPLETDDAIAGILDASILKDHIDKAAMFAFNIRRFLGMRQKSVNFDIKQTLRDPAKRSQFWKMNNGIVCLCTGATRIDDHRYHFESFTIVNGAQTTTTIARFLRENPLVAEPVWVMAKIVKVGETEVDKASLLTRSSNRQNPASSKDLRAVETIHSVLQGWYLQYLGITYVYKRGERAHRGSESISMKDLAQAYLAFWEHKPHVSFSRAGTIFTDDNLYGAVFPEEEVNRLKESGTDLERTTFLLKRLIPFRLLRSVRMAINTRVSTGTDKKWRSLAYHCVWAYGCIFESEHVEVNRALLDRLDPFAEFASPKVFNGLSDTLRPNPAISIPRSLKSTDAKDALLAGEFLQNSHIEDVRNRVHSVLLNQP